MKLHKNFSQFKYGLHMNKNKGVITLHSLSEVCETTYTSTEKLVSKRLCVKTNGIHARHLLKGSVKLENQVQTVGYP